MLVPFFFAAAVSTATLSQTFFARIADNGSPQTRPTVTVGALPSGWSAPAPLPQSVTLLGSVFSPHYQTQVYYQTPRAQSAMAAYVAQLQSAGFHRQYGFALSGFASAPVMQFSNVIIMCRGRQSVSVSAPAADDLRVAFPVSGLPNACEAHDVRISTPLPDLVPPPGVTLIPQSGGGATWGASQGMSSAYSSALIETKLSPKHLLSSFASQMRAANWKAQAPFTMPQAASQSFSYVSGTQHWTASVVIMPGDRAHSYVARLSASGTPSFNSGAAVSPSRPAAKLTRSQIPAALRLVQQIAGESNPGAKIYPQALPPQFNRALQMSAASLVGSVEWNDGVSVYYEATKAQFDTYVAQLQRAGWNPVATPHLGGFVLDPFSSNTTFCKPGQPVIFTRVSGPYSNDVNIRISNSPEAQTCSSAAFGGMRPTPFSPLPVLSTPRDAQMQMGSAGVVRGANGARIVSARPLSELLADFAANMKAANWLPATPLVSDALGSQSFSYTGSDGARWQAVITLYRSNADGKTYYAFVDVTPL